MEAVEVRPARPDELYAVAGLRWCWWHGSPGEPAVSRTEFVRGFVRWAQENAGTHRCFVAVRAETVIGMAWLAVTQRVPYPGALERATGDVQCVYVVPEARGAGLGGRLLDAVLACGRELGLERLVVHSSDRAIPAYERHGFAVSPRLLHTYVSR